MADSTVRPSRLEVTVSSANSQRTSGTASRRREEFRPLEFTREDLADGVVLFAVEGELEAASAERLSEAAFAALDARGTKVVLDLAECSFIDSTGLAVLLRIAGRVQGGDGSPGLAVVEGQLQVRRIFEITKLDGRLQVFPTRTEAIASLTPPRAVA
jgi:anti-sigma B factor antagonist